MEIKNIKMCFQNLRVQYNIIISLFIFIHCEGEKIELFYPPSSYLLPKTNSECYSNYDTIDISDINNDGIEDILSFDRALLGMGDGSFEGFRIPGEFHNLFDMDTGDFNNDKITDLIGYIKYIGNYTTGSYKPFNIYLGKGDGTFNSPYGPEVMLETGKVELNMVCLALISANNYTYIGDLNNDGFFDVVLPCFYDPGKEINMVGIMRGTKDGKFKLVGFLPVSKLYLDTISSADFNKDGLNDIIFRVRTVSIALPFPPIGWTYLNFQSHSSEDSIITIIFLNKGDMIFEYLVEYEGNYVHSIDFNKDGLLDLIGISKDGKEINLLVNNGDGTFNMVNLINYDSEYISNIIPEDFNSDNLIDVGFIGVGRDKDKVFLGVMFNEGYNAFHQIKNLKTFNLDKGIESHLVSADDFDRNGLPDIVIPLYKIFWEDDTLKEDFSLNILLGKGEDGFTDGGEYSVGHSIEGLLVNDFNLDGFQDIAVTDCDTVTIFINKGR